MVKLTQHFYNSKVHEGVQARILEQRFNIELESIQQGAGVVGDYRIKKNSSQFQKLFPDTEIIEFKNDKTSVFYRSFFCEFAQTTDDWYTSSDSGHLKAANEGCMLVIQSGQHFFCFTPENFLTLFSSATEEKKTRKNSNGNTNGAYTKAKIIHIKDCAEVYSFSI